MRAGALSIIDIAAGTGSSIRAAHDTAMEDFAARMDDYLINACLGVLDGLEPGKIAR